jgi:hypothetical protein
MKPIPWKNWILWHRPLPVRLWMWTAILALGYSVAKKLVLTAPQTGLFDTVIMAYGMASLAIYVLIYGFDWK